MAHLDPKGTIQKVVREYDADTDQWVSTFYLIDGNTDPPSEVIYTNSVDNGPTTGSTATLDLEGFWAGLYP